MKRRRRTRKTKTRTRRKNTRSRKKVRQNQTFNDDEYVNTAINVFKESLKAVNWEIYSLHVRKK